MADDNETEKITINVVPVDLGKMDLLVEQGLFSSRSDLIRTAIRRVLEDNAPVVQEEITRSFLNVGVVVFNQKDLLAMQKKGQRLKIRSVGRLILRPDVDPDTADAVIETILVKGSLKMTPEVRDRLADRIR
jgi:Arc/MetJ-type ribon-helix-helix transcriptional regulator